MTQLTQQSSRKHISKTKENLYLLKTTYTWMFTAALFMIVPKWKQLKYWLKIKSINFWLVKIIYI